MVIHIERRWSFSRLIGSKNCQIKLLLFCTGNVVCYDHVNNSSAIQQTYNNYTTNKTEKLIQKLQLF